MHSRSTLLLLLMPYLVLALMTPLSPAEIPNGPEVALRKAYLERVAALNERTMLLPFKPGAEQHDRQAEAFLREYALNDIGQRTMSDTERRRLVGATSACHEPLVHVMYAEDCFTHEQVPAALHRLKRWAPLLLEGDYPLNRKARACHMMRVALSRTDDTQQKEVYAKKAFEYNLQLLTSDVYLKDEQRVRWRDIGSRYLDGITIDEQARFYQEANKIEEADPWLVNMIGGEYHINAAWKARGDGPAGEVAEEGWKGFHDHLTQARECLTRAWMIRPDSPEAATCLIRVAMGGVRDHGRDERFWFDQAVRAEFDHMEAYRALELAIEPKWGGSLEAMHDFGLECFRTLRFDTLVPTRYYHVLQRITEVLDDEYLIWNEGDTYANMSLLFEKMIANEKVDEFRKNYQSLAIAMNWKLGRWEEALRELNRLKAENLNPKMTVAFDGFAPLIIEEVYAYAWTHASKIRMADLAAEAGKHAEAAQAYEAMLAELQRRGAPPRSRATTQPTSKPATQPATQPETQPQTQPAGPASRATSLRRKEKEAPIQRFLRRRAKESRWLEQFERGEWVDITPDEDFLNWHQYEGQWRIKNGLVDAYSNDDGMFLLCMTDFGPRYQLEATFQASEKTQPPHRHGAIFFRFEPLRDWFNHNLAANVAEGWASVRFRSVGPTSPQIPCEKGTGATLSVQVWDDDGVVGLVNGKMIYAGPLLENHVDRPPHQFGLGSRHWWRGEHLIFSQVRVRKLDQKPVELQRLQPEM